MKVKDYVYDKDRKVATIWLESIEQNELKQVLQHLEYENQKLKKPQIADDDLAVLEGIKES